MLRTLELLGFGSQCLIWGRCDGGYVHIQDACGLLACVVWERRWRLSLRTMTTSILPDAQPKRLRSQAGLHGFWGQVGDRDYDVFVQELKCIILSPRNNLGQQIKINCDR